MATDLSARRIFCRGYEYCMRARLIYTAQQRKDIGISIHFLEHNAHHFWLSSKKKTPPFVKSNWEPSPCVAVVFICRIYAKSFLVFFSETVSILKLKTNAFWQANKSLIAIHRPFVLAFERLKFVLASFVSHRPLLFEKPFEAFENIYGWIPLMLCVRPWRQDFVDTKTLCVARNVANLLRCSNLGICSGEVFGRILHGWRTKQGNFIFFTTWSPNGTFNEHFRKNLILHRILKFLRLFNTDNSF